MSDQWGTPQRLFDKINAEFRFDVDVCAMPDTAKCAMYYSPEDDALARDWSGTVWMNPPYGREIGAWMEKAYESSLKGATVVALIPNRSNAPWWHEWVMKANEIRFIRKKVGFVGGKKGVPFFGSVIAVFRPYKHSTVVSSYEQTLPPAATNCGDADAVVAARKEESNSEGKSHD